MKVLYTADNKYMCQVVNWPPRNTEQGWELDILCDPVLLGEFQDMRHCMFRVDSIEFEGLERILPVITPEDEMAQITLVFQHIQCTTIMYGANAYIFGLTSRIDAEL